ncbi:hypothetical protein GCM10020331_056270 [Ectobacillus funiculus]
MRGLSFISILKKGRIYQDQKNKEEQDLKSSELPFLKKVLGGSSIEEKESEKKL